MPGRDGTGPWGEGPATGRGLGPCGGGMRRGMGMGMGGGRRSMRGAGRGFGPNANVNAPATDVDALYDKAARLERLLARAEARVRELENASSTPAAE